MMKGGGRHHSVVVGSILPMVLVVLWARTMLVVWSIAAISVVLVGTASAEPHKPPSTFWAAVDDLAKPDSVFDVDKAMLLSLSTITPTHTVVFEDPQGTPFLTIDLERRSVTWEGSTDEAARKFWATVELVWPAMCPGAAKP